MTEERICSSCGSKDVLRGTDWNMNIWQACNHCGFDEIISGKPSKLIANEIKIDLIKIKICIVSFFQRTKTYPRPTDVVKEFQSSFGTNFNSETLMREMRRYAEEDSARLKRTEDNRYYFSDLENPTSLEMWV